MSGVNLKIKSPTLAAAWGENAKKRKTIYQRYIGAPVSFEEREAVKGSCEGKRRNVRKSTHSKLLKIHLKSN